MRRKLVRSRWLYVWPYLRDRHEGRAGPAVTTRRTRVAHAVWCAGRERVAAFALSLRCSEKECRT